MFSSPDPSVRSRSQTAVDDSIASQIHSTSSTTSSATATANAGAYADPDFLIEALEILAERSKKSVPALSEQAKKIVGILKKGEENDVNLSGIARFQGIIERMNNSVEKVRTSDSKQRARLEEISAAVKYVEQSLVKESESTSSSPLPLAVFVDSQPKTPFDKQMSEMYTAVVALELLARPELQRPAVHIITEDNKEYYITGPTITKSETFAFNSPAINSGTRGK